MYITTQQFKAHVLDAEKYLSSFYILISWTEITLDVLYRK